MLTFKRKVIWLGYNIFIVWIKQEIMKRILIIGLLLVTGMTACSDEETPCPAGNDMALQVREDSLNRWEQQLILREKQLLAQGQGTGNGVVNGTGTSDASAAQAVKTANASTINNYKANVRTAANSEPRVAYKRSSAAHPGQYPEASERLLTEKDLEYQTAWGKKIMLHEIYARKGIIFKDDALAKHFRRESWYKGKKAHIPAKALSSIERQNIAFIEAHVK